MSYHINTSKRFDKHYKLCKKRGYDMSLIQKAIRLLATNGSLPAEYRPHRLSAKFNCCWECHIKGDWLLLWEQNDDELTLLLTNTGTHSDIF